MRPELEAEHVVPGDVLGAAFQVDGDPIPALSALTLGWGAAVLATIGLEARRRLQRRG